MSDLEIEHKGKIVIAESGGVQIIIDHAGKILTPEESLMHLQYINDSETEIALDIIRSKKPTPVIPIEVYFRHVKASLETIDELKLRPYIQRLSRVAKNMKSLGQVGGYEESIRRLVLSARELEMKQLHNIKFSITREAVSRFISYTGEQDADWLSRKDAPVRMKNFKDFPRLVPKHVTDIINEHTKKEIFDHFEVVYIDTSGQSDDVGETAETTRSKDPILFGVTDLDPNKLYYITAWDDEHCDLTFDEMVENANFDEGDFSHIPEADEINEEYIERLEEEVRRSSSNRFRSGIPVPPPNQIGGSGRERQPSRVWERIKAAFRMKEKTKNG